MKIKFEDIRNAIERDNGIGFCLACGEEADGCEPDACEYRCRACDEFKVYGAEEVLIMGEVE